MNLGDALEFATAGLFRATPHRVRQRANATRSRFSMPFFFDPSFDAPLRAIHLTDQQLAEAARRRAQAPARWDGRDVTAFNGATYGDYLLAKTAQVFPELARSSRAAL